MFIEIFGEVVDEKWPRLRRAAARMIVQEFGRLRSAEQSGDLAILALILGEFEDRLARASTGFCQELLHEDEPYPTKGITFTALVHLVRIEQDALAWGWTPEQLQALGLAIKQGENLTWLTQEWAEICDRNGNRRRHYRLVSKRLGVKHKGAELLKRIRRRQRMEAATYPKTSQRMTVAVPG